MFKKAIGYVEELGLLGAVTNYNFLTDEITLLTDLNDENSSHVVKNEYVELLHFAFEINDVEIFDKDILGAVNGKSYQVEVHSDGEVQLHLVNDRLEFEKSGEKFKPTKEILSQLSEVMDLLGNYYELISEVSKTPSFNVKIVKHFDGSNYTYYYACNNKEVEQIDLIKVLYMGHQLLEEEEYERNTLSYEDYLSRIEDKNFTEVSPQELHNFVLGATYGKESYNGNETVEEDISEEASGELEDDSELLW
jgi:hypothetical protein